MMHSKFALCLIVASMSPAYAAPVLELSATAGHSHEPLVLKVGSVGAEGAIQSVPWPESQRVAWLFVRVSGTQENRDAQTLGSIDADGARRVMPGAAGVALVGCDLVPSSEMWTADQANAFARVCGEEDLCFKDNILVHHSISAACLTQVAAAPGDQARFRSNTAATGKSGQASEIRPLMDPLAIEGGDLAFRVYVGGEAVPRAAIRAVHVESGVVQSVQADAKGIGVVRVDLPGAWRLEFHTITAIPDSQVESWQATSCTLTFSARGVQQATATANHEVKP